MKSFKSLKVSLTAWTKDGFIISKDWEDIDKALIELKRFRESGVVINEK